MATEVFLFSFHAPTQKQNELKTWPEANSLPREPGALLKRWVCGTPTASSVPQIWNQTIKDRTDAFFFHARLSDHQVSNPTAVAALEMKCLITDRSDWQQTAAPGNLEGLWRGSSWHSLIMKYLPFKPAWMRSRNHLPAGGRLAATQPAGPLEGWGRAKAAGAVRQRLQQQEARSPKVSFVSSPNPYSTTAWL